MRIIKMQEQQLVSVGIVVLFIGLVISVILTPTGWDAPESSIKIENPMIKFKNSEVINNIGKKEYMAQCSTCHGNGGIGDGPAGRFLQKAPGDLTTKEFNKQSDGEIFWKINTGKSPMPAFKDILSEKKIWIIINHLRTLKKKNSETI